MDIVTLDEIKANSRIDGDEEDALIQDIGRTAEEMVANMTRRTWWEIEADYGCIPHPLKRAVLMLADHLYSNRGATAPMGMNIVPMGVAMMVKPYIILK